MTLAELQRRARGRGHGAHSRLLGEWLRELVRRGLVVELAPDDFALTDAGRTRFAGLGETADDEEELAA